MQHSLDWAGGPSAVAPLNKLYVCRDGPGPKVTEPGPPTEIQRVSQIPGQGKLMGSVVKVTCRTCPALRGVATEGLAVSANSISDKKMAQIIAYWSIAPNA